MAWRAATPGPRSPISAAKPAFDRDDRHLNVPVEPIAAEEAMAHFGFLGGIAGLDDPTSNVYTSELLD